VTSSLDGVDRRPVPVRTILATIGLVLATALLIYMVLQIRQVLTWIVVGAFFAVALYPVVGWVQRRMLGGKRRALATFRTTRTRSASSPAA
jgi:predicted PurR-regulated permease PerM